jgi:hypothetical protein
MRIAPQFAKFVLGNRREAVCAYLALGPPAA